MGYAVIHTETRRIKQTLINNGYKNYDSEKLKYFEQNKLAEVETPRNTIH